jgi:hypothetical protein
MPRTYFDKRNRIPFFSNERGVGVSMANDRLDVVLVQCLLKAIMYSNKPFAGGSGFSRPKGPELIINGLWDAPSRNVLEAWETNVVLAKIQIRVDQVKLDPTSAYQHPKTAFPGTVVPYREGGKKIIDMAKICIQLFGDTAYADLAFPGVSVPAELAKELFYGS